MQPAEEELTALHSSGCLSAGEHEALRPLSLFQVTSYSLPTSVLNTVFREQKKQQQFPCLHCCSLPCLAPLCLPWNRAAGTVGWVTGSCMSMDGSWAAHWGWGQSARQHGRCNGVWRSICPRSCVAGRGSDSGWRGLSSPVCLPCCGLLFW